MKMMKSEPVTIAEVSDILKKRAEEGELGYEQQASLEHAEKFSSAEAKKAKELFKQLTKNEKITPETAVKLIDIYPQTASTVRTVLLKDRVELSDEEVNEIVKIFEK
ncbi:RNA polymerase Rpb4 family protein [Candidatus Micrarchaeota archaeon]|nr:RNA polymerase Rpb4 family protein [Candidatus Micrarchaeota archaeon]